MDKIALIIATIPFIWLTLIYLLDYFLDFSEKSFFAGPLQRSIAEINVIRELCFSNLGGKSCPIFRNLEMCIGKNDFTSFCTYEPWFRSDDIKKPEDLAKRLTTPETDLDRFLSSLIVPNKREMLKEMLLSQDEGNTRLKTNLSDILNDLIRDHFIYDEVLFRDVTLGDSDLEEIAKLKNSNSGPFKHLQLNSFLIEKSYKNYLKPRIYINRVWKLIRDGCYLCTMQAHFLEFVALEALIIYLNKYHENKVTELANYFIVGFILIILILWGITISQGDPFPIFRSKSNRLLAAISILGFSAIIIII